MDNTHNSRHFHQPAGKPPSPRLLRSRSGAPAPATSRPEAHAFASSPGRRPAKNRPRSTTKSRTNGTDEENLINPSTRISRLQKKTYSEKKDDLIRFLQSPSRRNGRDGAEKTRKALSSPPSAWALSPGRSPKMELQLQHQQQKSKMGGGSVFKYFRQKKKVCPVRDEEFHKLRVLHNTLVQWRWANARAEAAMAATKIVAQDKIFSVWVRMLKMRKSIVEGRIELARLKHEMKLLQIVKPEMSLLNEWAKIEKKNCEAVGKLATKLWAQATTLPLREGAKGDVMGVYNAMRMAVEVMQSIEEMLSAAFFPQAEKTVDLLQQLITMLQQHKKWSHELHRSIPIYASLQGRELSLRAHVIQAAMGDSSTASQLPNIKMYHVLTRSFF